MRPRDLTGAQSPWPVAARGDRRLLVRVPNWVGDVVMALPVLEALGRAGFDVVVAGRAWVDDLLSAYPLQRTPVTRNHLAAAAILRRLGVSDGVLLTQSFGSALEMRLAGVRAVGFRTHGRAPLLYRSLAMQNGAHLLDRHWRIGALACATFGGAAGIFSGAPDRPVMRLSPTHRRDADAALAEAGIELPFQVWCPLATSTIHGRSKLWPHFAELCRRMVADGTRVACCPGPGQEEAVRLALPGARVLSGLGLGAMAAVMERAQLVLANDTGPMHVAAGVGVPVLGLFGPGNDPHRTGPIGGKVLGGTHAWPDLELVRREVTRHATPRVSSRDPAADQEGPRTGSAVPRTIASRGSPR